MLGNRSDSVCKRDGGSWCAAHALAITRNQVVDHLAALDQSSQNVQTMIPMQVLLDIDNAKNPMVLTKDRLERAATENQFMNGKIAAIEVFFLVPDASPFAYTSAVLQILP